MKNIKVERETGFEPATSTLARWRSSQLSYSRSDKIELPELVREAGFEPAWVTPLDPKSSVSSSSTTLAYI